MRKISKISLMCGLFLLALALPLAPRAQDANKQVENAKVAEPAPQFFHLVFLVQELDAAGKPVNSRSYTTTVGTKPERPQSIRTGSRVPVVTSESSSANVQYQYIDVGINFDIRNVVEIQHQLALDLSAEVSSIANASDARVHAPVIRQNKWQALVLIPLGKPTIVFTSDSLDSKGNLQITVTATPLQ